MRKTYMKKVYFEELNKKIAVIGILFILFVLLGTFLNKMCPGYENIVMDSVNEIEKYYSSRSSIEIKNVILSNLKLDFKFIALIGILNLLVITFPISILIFMLKGVSIGYTINSCILLLKAESMNIVFISLVKNFAIIPGAIILMVISINYLQEIIKEFKYKNNKNMIFLLKRYLLNLVIVISVSLIVQVLLNFIFINILQFLVR
ncbi:MAG: stage II sporulation protein M [Peptostreptococcaceae bacterium]